MLHSSAKTCFHASTILSSTDTFVLATVLEDVKAMESDTSHQNKDMKLDCPLMIDTFIIVSALEDVNDKQKLFIQALKKMRNNSADLSVHWTKRSSMSPPAWYLADSWSRHIATSSRSDQPWQTVGAGRQVTGPQHHCKAHTPKRPEVRLDHDKLVHQDLSP